MVAESLLLSLRGHALIDCARARPGVVLEQPGPFWRDVPVPRGEPGVDCPGRRIEGLSTGQCHLEGSVEEIVILCPELDTERVAHVNLTPAYTSPIILLHLKRLASARNPEAKPTFKPRQIGLRYEPGVLQDPEHAKRSPHGEPELLGDPPRRFLVDDAHSMLSL